jgi:hypothetical protein
VDIWGYGARANDLVSWFFNPSVDAAEQVRRQKLRSAFLELMRAVKESDILLFAAAVDTIGNNLEVAPPRRPLRAFDVVSDLDADVAAETEASGELIR